MTHLRKFVSSVPEHFYYIPYTLHLSSTEFYLFFLRIRKVLDNTFTHYTVETYNVLTCHVWIWNGTNHIYSILLYY